MHELRLTPAQFGALNSAFFIFFVPLQLVGGVLADRYPAKWILFAMAVIWSLSMAPLVVPAGFTALLVSRIALGAGEAPTTPVAIHALYKWFPDKRRAIPNAFYSLGPPMAMTLGAPVLVWLIAGHGWRACFLVLGLLSLAWALIWLAVGEEGPLTAAPSAGPRSESRTRGYLRIVGSRTFLGALLLGFPSYFGLTIMFAWLPHFLQSAVHLDTNRTAWVISGAWGILGFGPLIVSYISQRMMDRGASARVARGYLAAGLFVFSGVLLVLARLLDIPPAAQAVMLIVGLPLGVVCNPLLFTLLGQLSPLQLRGGVMGVFGSGNVLAGLIAPLAMGYSIQMGSNELEGYLIGFTCYGVGAILCGILAFLLINPEADEQRFREVHHA
jgi:MFS family permease